MLGPISAPGHAALTPSTCLAESAARAAPQPSFEVPSGPCKGFATRTGEVEHRQGALQTQRCQQGIAIRASPRRRRDWTR
eukprot:5521-Chlamydomonas_euryale.AAC.1